MLSTVLLVGCQAVRSIIGSGPDPALVDQLTRYLRASPGQAEELLPYLLRQPLTELEPALGQALLGPSLWDRESIETGMLPGRQIQVGDGMQRYGLYVPPSYDPERTYPLIVCLHGAGFDGDSYLERWQPRLGEAYILACPSLQFGAWWAQEGEALVLAVLDEVSRQYHIDRHRVFLTGMSNGGLGTYLIGLNHTDRFAALIPMAGAFPRGFYPLFDNARHTPFYIIHGSKDQVIPVFFSRNISEHLEKRGHDVLYREHDREHPMAGGHFFPREELPALMAWLADQRRNPMPEELLVVRDRDHTHRTGWVRIDEIAPTVGSLWASELDKEESRRLEAGAYARLDARVEGNTIWVNTKGVRKYSLMIPRGLVDLNWSVRVITNGKVSFDDRVKLDSRTLLVEARKRPDPAQLVLAVIEIRVPSS